jgi:hypothetical protein
MLFDIALKSLSVALMCFDNTPRLFDIGPICFTAVPGGSIMW